MTPEGWERRRVREFCERLKRVNSGGLDLEPLSITKDRGVIPQSEKYNKRIATDPKKYVLAEDGDFAFDPMSLYYGAIGRVAGIGRGLVSPDYVVFEADETVDGDFLHALLRYPEMHKLYESLSETGNTFGKRRRLYWSIFEDIELALPPLPEQRKLAAILSSVDDAIEATQAVIDQLAVVKKAMMAELLTRGLPGRHTKFKHTEIGEVPEEWNICSLGEVAELQPGYPFRSADFVSWGDRLLRGSNVGVGRLDWGLDKTVYFPTERRDEVTEFVLAAGDIIVAMDRPFISDGFKIARLTSEDLPALLLQRVGRFRRLKVSASFLWMLLHSHFVQDHLKTLQKGTDLPHISKTEIESCCIPLPKPQEQAAIGAVVDDTDARLDSEQQVVAALRSLKTALMSVLLTGEVRVKPEEAA